MGQVQPIAKGDPLAGTSPSAAVALSEIDEARFGVRTARVDPVASDNLPQVLAFCEQHAVDFLIARCPVDDLAAVHAMEDAGFQLMDTLLYYESRLDRPLPRHGSGTLIRPLRTGEAETVAGIARVCFRRYRGHYHADPRLDPRLCDETYVSWARRCCALEAADVVLVAESDRQLDGFAAIQRHPEGVAELVLGAVAPQASGRGLYRALAIGAMRWGRKQRADRFLTSTQITNVAAQKAWAAVGLTLARSSYTFHRWFT